MARQGQQGGEGEGGTRGLQWTWANWAVTRHDLLSVSLGLVASPALCCVSGGGSEWPDGCARKSSCSHGWHVSVCRSRSQTVGPLLSGPRGWLRWDLRAPRQWWQWSRRPRHRPVQVHALLPGNLSAKPQRWWHSRKCPPEGSKATQIATGSQPVLSCDGPLDPLDLFGSSGSLTCVARRQWGSSSDQ